MSARIASCPLPPAALLERGGEMGGLVRAHDWSSTALGPIGSWPQSLRTNVGTVLGSKFPMLLWWGPDLVQLYNDAYRPILGDKHPRSLGAPGAQVWAEIWHIIGPMAVGIQAGGPATWSEHLLLPMKRKGYLEETYFTFSYSPVPDDDGRTGGVLVTCQETTAQVLSERRMQTLQRMSTSAANAPSGQDAAQRATVALGENRNDVPFAALYLLEADGQRLTLAGSTGMGGAFPERLHEAELRGDRKDWPLQRTFHSREPIEVELPADVASRVERDALPPSTRAVMVPIDRGPGERPCGVLVFGLSGRLEFDDSYRGFVGLATAQVSSAYAQAEAYEQQRRRAEALAQLDQAKTAFFSNVSHEFRTPLTLLMGPLEESLHDRQEPLPPRQRERLELIRRSGVRLMKLVNTLLDFSRLEAGRLTATYRPTDLGEATGNLASSFRSLMENAGLRLEVECSGLEVPVYLDRDMWEKIVLNLLSNAFKFTLQGSVRVTVSRRDEHAVLEISDTGTGIPAEELPRVFDRFHRVEGARGRSFEGSGIGLALVRELVRLHGGTISAESVVDKGSRFTVMIPLGRGHLPVDRIAEGGADAGGTSAQAFVEEASEWLGQEDPVEPPPSVAQLPGHVLLAEDNADMRAYLRGLLEGAGWSVTAVGDGEAAVAAAKARPPDLVLTDVMMPRLDGFGVLRALRESAATRTVPVVMLSARAGEDARLDGLQAGADDYLVKPFSARELLARVAIHLELSRARRGAENHRQSLHEMFMAAPAMIAVLKGPGHVFELANPLYLRAVGSRDIIGKPIHEALPELVGQRILKLLDNAYRTGVAESGREVSVSLDRHGHGVIEEGFFNFTYHPSRDASGTVDGILVFAFDVTDHVQARRKAEALSDELKLAGKRKDEFLAMLAHELRNPMAALSMALSVIERSSSDDPRARKFRQNARRQVGMLVRLVDDLLDVSRITRGQVELRKERVDFNALIHDAVASARPSIEDRSHELSLTVAPGSFELEADPTRLEQVVVNLLTNAAKYTPPGGSISVRLGREVRGGDDWAVLRVKDTGRGIPAPMIDQVFDAFVQVDSTLDRQLGGLGLGLTLVKQLVELHGGTVSAHSDGPGKGTEFVVQLKLPGRASASVSDVVPRAAVDVPNSRRRVLIIEDSEDVREGLKELLEDFGHEVSVAADGTEGLRCLLELQPDIALVDVGLPGIDGYDVARGARADPLGRNLYLVALTGYGGREARDKAVGAGFDLHLTKPIDVDELPRLVERARRA